MMMAGVRTLLLAVALFMSLKAQARDSALLDKALSDSNQERAGVEHDFKQSDSSASRGGKEPSLRAISLEIGDELGADGGADAPTQVSRRDYTERGSTKKLDREWKDVNKSFQKVEPPGFSRSGRRL